MGEVERESLAAEVRRLGLALQDASIQAAAEIARLNGQLQDLENEIDRASSDARRLHLEEALARGKWAQTSRV